MKAIFDTRADTGYDDDIIHRYHFPNVYLPVAENSVGDWIVYRGTKRGGGRKGYVAVAKVARVVPDPNDDDSSYAYVTDFLSFDPAVPLSCDGRYYEELLDRVPKPTLIGPTIRGKSIRTISDREFDEITRAGLSETLDRENAHRLELNFDDLDADARAAIDPPPDERERRVERLLVNRKIRDAAFRRSVLDAYDSTCAVTGLRMINGKGRAEVQAAHIWPVAAGGPDVVRNGIALSATCHWLFDRHLISLTEDYGLLVSHNRVPPEMRRLFEARLERVHLPTDERLWPHPDYMARYRESFA